MKDYRMISPTSMVISNEASLTCSRGLMTVLNKGGIAYSYAKDLKDSKLSRQLWNSYGIENPLEKCLLMSTGLRLKF